MTQYINATPIRGYVQGMFGVAVRQTAKDLSGSVVDLSAYDGTLTIYARHETTGKEISATITFTTDGTDGVYEYSYASGDVDRAGLWIVQAVFINSGVSSKLKTVPQDMEVELAIDG